MKRPCFLLEKQKKERRIDCSLVSQLINPNPMKSQTMRWEMLNLTKNAQTHIQTTTIKAHENPIENPPRISNTPKP